MSERIFPRCTNLGSAKHICSYNECEKCTLSDIQARSNVNKDAKSKK